MMWRMMGSKKAIVVVTAMLLASCGDTRHHAVEVKKRMYHFSLELPQSYERDLFADELVTPAMVLRQFLNETFAELNYRLQEPRFILASSHIPASQMNSSILVKDLDHSESHEYAYNPRSHDPYTPMVVGLGRMTQFQVTEVSRYFLHKSIPLQTITHISYGMTIQLSNPWVMSQLVNRHQDHELQLLKILVYHEIGHGLGWDCHSDDSTDIMHPLISLEKDLEDFFARVDRELNLGLSHGECG